MSDIPLAQPQDAFPEHVFSLFDLEPGVLEHKIGGAVLVTARQPDGGPVVLVTAGVSRLPLESGPPIELAVEVAEGQEGAAMVALQFVCDDIAQNRRTPPVESPWRNAEPFLEGTQISAIMLTGSRWGAAVDDVRDPLGSIVGHVRTLRLLTDAEAEVASEAGWSGLLEQAGGPDALVDVLRASTVVAPPRDVERMPVLASNLHDEHPPRWITLQDGMFHSVTGLESEEYMADASNHQVHNGGSFLSRFGWTRDFLEAAKPGETARFDAPGAAYVLETD